MFIIIKLAITLLILYTCVHSTYSETGENYNLFGIPGQGYLVEVRIGQPQQKLNVLIDTGSSTLAVAAKATTEVTTYFHPNNSTTLLNIGEEVLAKYSQGGWQGNLASDFVQFPSVDPEITVRSDIVLITVDYDFFTNGSGWQGILGLAYSVIAVSNSEISVQPWLDSLEKLSGDTKSFELTLCGVRSTTNATHYGRFMLLDNKRIKSSKNSLMQFKTPILRERWYEVGVLGVRVLNISMGKSTLETGGLRSNLTLDIEYEPKEQTCQLLNSVKSIVDSGTTNIRLPAVVFRQVVDDLRSAALTANLLILDDFWYHGEAVCWPQPRQSPLPWLAIDLLDADDENQYFTLELPPQNYFRLVSADNSNGTVSEFCYNFGLESDVSETVLGVAAMEGFQVIFNRSHNFISWASAGCGPSVRLSGPYKTNSSIRKLCSLEKSTDSSSVSSVRTAQWAAVVGLTVAMMLLLYLLAPCLRNRCISLLRRRSSQSSSSRTALVSLEWT